MFYKFNAHEMSLYNSEYDHFKKKLGTKCHICNHGIVQLYVGGLDKQVENDDEILIQYPSLRNEDGWVFTRVVGALLLVEDKELNTTYFQIYDLENDILRFQFELYEDIEYNELLPHFHSFEMDQCHGGFNFSCQKTAKSFLESVQISKPKKYIPEPSTSIEQEKLIDTPSAHESTLTDNSTVPKPRIRKRDYILKKLTRKRSPKKRNGSTDINIRIAPDGTLDLSNVPSEWKAIFRDAGIRKRDLTNPEIAESIEGAMKSAGIEPDKKVLVQSYSRRLRSVESADVGDQPIQEVVSVNEETQSENTSRDVIVLPPPPPPPLPEVFKLDAVPESSVVDTGLLPSKPKHTPSLQQQGPDPVLDKYKRMLKAGVPHAAIEIRMNADHVDPNLLFNASDPGRISSNINRTSLNLQESYLSQPLLSDIQRGVVTLRRVSQCQALPHLSGIKAEVQETLMDRLKFCVIQRRQNIASRENGETDDTDSDEDEEDDWSDDF